MKRLGMTRREDMDFESADVPRGHATGRRLADRRRRVAGGAGRRAPLEPPSRPRSPRSARTGGCRSRRPGRCCRLDRREIAGRNPAALLQRRRRPSPSMSPSARVVGARAAWATDSACCATTQLSLCGARRPARAAPRLAAATLELPNRLPGPGRPAPRGAPKDWHRPGRSSPRWESGRADRSPRRPAAPGKGRVAVQASSRPASSADEPTIAREMPNPHGVALGVGTRRLAIAGLPSRRAAPYVAPLPFPGSAPVAQLDRASDYESEGRRFESFRARQFLLKL